MTLLSTYTGKQDPAPQPRNLPKKCLECWQNPIWPRRSQKIHLDPMTDHALHREKPRIHEEGKLFTGTIASNNWLPLSEHPLRPLNHPRRKKRWARSCRRCQVSVLWTRDCFQKAFVLRAISGNK